MTTNHLNAADLYLGESGPMRSFLSSFTYGAAGAGTLGRMRPLDEAEATVAAAAVAPCVNWVERAPEDDSAAEGARTREAAAAGPWAGVILVSTCDGRGTLATAGLGRGVVFGADFSDPARALCAVDGAVDVALVARGAAAVLVGGGAAGSGVLTGEAFLGAVAAADKTVECPRFSLAVLALGEGDVATAALFSAVGIGLRVASFFSPAIWGIAAAGAPFFPFGKAAPVVA